MAIPAAVLRRGALLPLLVACQTAQPPEQICTLVGCMDGISVVVENAPPAPYAVEVALPDGTRRTARCEAAAECDAGVFVEDVMAPEVTVTVTGSSGSRSQTVRPAYREVQPNGPRCPPTCRFAQVRVRYGS